MANELYLDRNEIPFDLHVEAREGVPSQWGYMTIKEDKRGTQAEFHWEWGSSACWWCLDWPLKGNRFDHQLHHLFAGSRGRSHQTFLYCWACKKCHENWVREEDLGRWLYLKWKNDPEHTDWCDMAARHCGRLPDLITD